MNQIKALVVTVSTRAAKGEYEDLSGPILVAGLNALGFEVRSPLIIEDGFHIRNVLAQELQVGYQLIITTGGTGISPSDVTPECTSPFITQSVPGIAEALRSFAIAQGQASGMLSRGVSGMAGNCMLINLPGSQGAVRDALIVLTPVLQHVFDQRNGFDH